MDNAAEQRPSRQRTNKIADKADPCVVPREILNVSLWPLLMITAPIRLVSRCIMRFTKRLGVSMAFRKPYMY